MNRQPKPPAKELKIFMKLDKTKEQIRKERQQTAKVKEKDCNHKHTRWNFDDGEIDCLVCGSHWTIERFKELEKYKKLEETIQQEGKDKE